MKRVVNLFLLIIIIILSYLIFNSILQPIRFNKEKNKRYKATILRLKDIRTAQIAFKSVYGRYTENFDSLIAFFAKLVSLLDMLCFYKNSMREFPLPFRKEMSRKKLKVTCRFCVILLGNFLACFLLHSI